MSFSPQTSTECLFNEIKNQIHIWLRDPNLKELTPRYNYAWMIMSSCCQLMDGIRHLELYNMPQFITYLLGIYIETMDIAESYAEEPFIQNVVEAFRTIRDFLRAAAYELQKKRITYTVLREYSNNCVQIQQLYQLAGLQTSFTMEELGRLNTQYNNVNRELSELLILQLPKSEFPHCQSQQLRDALNSYGVDISQLQQINQNFKMVQTTNNLYAIEPMPDIKISDYETLTNEIKVFLQPLDSYHNFFSHFHLQKNELFDACIEYYCSTLRETGQLFLVEHFVSALKSTKSLLISILNGESKYADIKPIVERLNFKNLNFDLLRSQFRKYPDFAKHKIDLNFMDMFELLQYKEQLPIVIAVCKKYKLAGCINSGEFAEINQYAEQLQKDEIVNELTILSASHHLKCLKKFLSNVTPPRLKIFEVMMDAQEFYTFFVDDEYYKEERKSVFFDEIELITRDMQNEEYNDKILSHLQIAYNFILPFCDAKQNFTQLMNQISSDKFVHGESSGFEQLSTVSLNVNLIKLWFLKSKGETSENDAQQLEEMLLNGFFEINLNTETIKYKDYAPVSLLEPSKGFTVDDQNNSTNLYGSLPIVLKYKASVRGGKRPETELIHSNSESNEDENSIFRIMTKDMMNDFVRKLGFMEFDQKESLREKAQKFKLYYSAIRQLTDVLISLHYYGHPNFINHGEIIAFSVQAEEIEEKTIEYRNILITWREGIYKLQDKYKLLCHFTMQRVCTITQHLNNGNWLEAAQHLAFLFDRVPELLENLSTWLKNNISPCKNSENRAQYLGEILTLFHETPILKNNMSILDHAPRLIPQSSIEQSKIVYHHVHRMHNFSDEQIMCLLFTFYEDKPYFVPHNTEILHCSSITTEEELDLFLKKGETFYHFTYTMLKVNLLPTHLQEKIVSHMSKNHSTLAKTHYIETGPSVLGELSTISIHMHTPVGEEHNASRVMCICSDYLLKKRICEIHLVYGAEGIGKSHYILKEVENAKKEKDIAVIHIPIHEGFSLSSVIRKVKEGFNSRITEGSIMYFNFTIAMPSDSDHESDDGFKLVMSSINWFLFDILILGCVYDPVTGECFYMPSGLNWKFYVEVPIQIYDSALGPSDNQRYLHKFQTYVPIFKFVGTPMEIMPSVFFQVDEKVQLVCKYLKAYDEFINRKDKTKLNYGINILYNERNKQKVCFRQKLDITERACLDLLNRYMHQDIKHSKTLQKIYINYMYRRCKILEDFPQFNFNTGASEIFVEDEDNPERWKKIRIDMKRLGSTLMKIMLDEVNLTFCSLTLNKDWNSVEHHQLVYECVGGAYTISYLSLAPEKLDKTLVQELANIGVFVPPREKLAQRTLLDPFLARAMGIRLLESTKILDIIDQENYVLTSDFVMKMININERRMCKVPVIIEGETGVGKTELIRMLSILWTKSHLEYISFWKSHLAGKINEKISLENGEIVLKYFNLVLKLQQYSDDISIIDLAANFKTLIELIKFYFTFFVREFTTLISNPAFYLLDLKDEENRTYNNLIQKLSNSSVTVEDCREMAQLLCQIFNSNMLPTFHKYNVHSALTPEDIKAYFLPIITKSNHITEKHGHKFPNPPIITVFIDEINTSSCLGMFKEIIIDNSIDGTPLPNNLFLIAASNPHRATSIPISTHSARSDWVLGWYHVKEIHPTMQLLKWNFGALSHEQEAEYVKSLMRITANKMRQKRDSCRYFDNLTESENSRLSTFISRAQKNVREFAKDTLMKLEFDESEAIVRSKSSVSQRDIQRVFHLIEFFGSYIEPRNFAHDKPVNPYMICRRIVFVAVGVVYYLKLDPDHRKIFRAKMQIDLETQSFEMVFEDEIKYLIEKTELPPGIALTQGLKENLFSTIVCTATKIPLIIIGPPGTSKTLSFNLTVQNLNKARQLESTSIQNLNFPSLDPHYYQCSRKSTSKEIENVFKRAIFRQDGNNQANLLVNCVVFLDEAGLPEEQQDSLKVLHYYLDKPVVSFVAISNHILDAAKSNRAINVFRPQMQEKVS